ncbi:hypothetical protein CDL12_23046 [Handroanthus impetiginosus]|uniref:RING-type domain-containing protein n=1 Tax=Handroanthus impetiginosus TaxID=429701 RepID=A0A2G9GGK0_9LAMI|nr:hypothetical protein CDL12_23046 [Handroanthus impetiginosus]
MGCGNPPVLTPTEEMKYGLSRATKPGGADDGGWIHGASSFGPDITPLPFISLGYSHFPRHDMQGDCHFYPPEYEKERNRLGGYMDLNCLTDSNIDANLIKIKSDTSEFHRESKMSYPEEGMKELRHAIDGSNTVSPDCFMNPAFSSKDYRKSEVHTNFILPRSENATGYPIKAHGAEANTSRASRSRISGKFSFSECSTSVLPLVDNFGVTGNKNDINIGSPQIVDGNFLTLGIGCGTEIRSSQSFSTEISSKFGDTVAYQCNSSIVNQRPKDPLSLPELTCRAATVQTKSGGLSSSACNLADRMSISDEGELFGDTSARLNSNPLAGLQTPQADARSIYSSKYGTSLFDPAPSSLPFRSTLVSQPERVTSNKCSQPERVTPNPFGPEVTKSTYFASQFVPQQQDYSRKRFMNFSCGSSRNYLSDRLRRSSISHEQLGKLIPVAEGRETQSNTGLHLPVNAQPLSTGNLNLLPEDTRTEVTRSGSFPSSIQPLGHLQSSHNVSSCDTPGNSLFPERIGVQISSGGTFQSAAAGPFPKRLGVQSNDFAAPRAAKVAKLDLRPEAPPIVSYSSLKRQATENPPKARLSQRRKIFPQPFMYHSSPRERQNIAATPVHIPPAPLHIKWQGFDGPLEPIGCKCLLCKRDLSFTAEGRAYQPANPPAIAVLPCGHTFHDHCLQKITPEDQSKDPPCIPCAIGET